MSRAHGRRRPTAGGLAIRTAVAADAGALAALDARCFPPGDRFSPRVWRHLLGVARRNRSALAVLAHEDAAVLGAAALLLRAGSRVARLYTVAVDPAARGRGLARRLLAALLARAPRRCATLSLEVRASNAGARALYEALGMTAVASLPRYYDDEDGVRYRAPLAGVRAACAR